jgi:hypothetical protein
MMTVEITAVPIREITFLLGFVIVLIGIGLTDV